jgi:hypothetical protein
MRKAKSFRYLAIPVALLALLLVSMTLGSLWHHHTGTTESSCPICHLSHQPIDRPLSPSPTPAFAIVTAAPEPADLGFAPSPFVPLVPARAPPAA